MRIQFPNYNQKSINFERFYADATVSAVSAEARDKDTMQILSRW